MSQPLLLSSEDRRALLARARQAILDVVIHDRIPDLDAPSGALAQPSGVFVTLHVRGRLRGCVGQVEPNVALAETVVQSAIGAALRDSRFAPLGKADIDELEISISVLSELTPISAQAIEIGRHGLLVIRGERRGLLLPQVAVERKWSAQRFLEETCEKAGLAPQAWSDPGTQLFAFTVEVFSESDFRTGYSSST